mmetsp:Transcript_34882/g.76125  ORF Transcript_34882/g.76125 Transcript_34882/m.76125 type:complete len:222 (-) Transcript_34882:694-1359(-)
MGGPLVLPQMLGEVGTRLGARAALSGSACASCGHVALQWRQRVVVDGRLASAGLAVAGGLAADTSGHLHDGCRARHSSGRCGMGDQHLAPRACRPHGACRGAHHRVDTGGHDRSCEGTFCGCSGALYRGSGASQCLTGWRRRKKSSVFRQRLPRDRHRRGSGGDTQDKRDLEGRHRGASACGTLVTRRAAGNRGFYLEVSTRRRCQRPCGHCDRRQGELCS